MLTRCGTALEWGVTASAATRRLIREIADKIRREYRPERIVLFGSYANGNPGPDSDIDLLIIKETSDRPIDRRVKVAGIAADPHRLIPLEPIVVTPAEVAVRTAIGDQFLAEILATGETLYAEA
jgi:predicted nucleotidyltransferase